jgi:hypothetical protein
MRPSSSFTQAPCLGFVDPVRNLFSCIVWKASSELRPCLVSLIPYSEIGNGNIVISFIASRISVKQQQSVGTSTVQFYVIMRPLPRQCPVNQQHKPTLAHKKSETYIGYIIRTLTRLVLTQKLFYSRSTRSSAPIHFSQSRGLTSRDSSNSSNPFSNVFSFLY